MDREWLIDELEDVVYITDPETYEIIYVNPAGEKSMGIENLDYKGQKCYKVMQGYDSPCEFCTNNIIDYDKFHVWEHTNKFINRHFILKDKLIKHNNKPARMEIAIDITEKENISRGLQDRLEIENTIVKCIRSLISSKDLNEAVKLVLEGIGKFYISDRAYIIEFDFQAKTANNTYEWCNDNVIPQIGFVQGIKLDMISRWLDYFYEEKPIIIENIEDIKVEYSYEYEILKQQDVTSLYAVPFNIQGKLGGYIGIDNPSAHLGHTNLVESVSYFVVNEITKRRMNKELEFISYHDALTGLPNRNSYMKCLSNIKDSELFSAGVVVLDINGLKAINENYGHSYGDMTIKCMVDIVKKYFDENRVFRLSGDEFVVVCENIDRGSFVAKVKDAKKGLNNMENGGVSLGYTWSNADIDISILVQHADEIMYIEKQRYYRNSLVKVKHHDPKKLNILLDYLEKGMFQMYLQPKADIYTGEIVGAEALVRLIHPKLGVIPPSKFIQVLECERTIKYIDLFIYEEVLKTLDSWRKKGYRLMTISLNFSRITMLSEDLVKVLMSINDKYNIPLELVEIEITESIGEIERETIREISSSIRKQGFSISLDDFGQKYTNMSMLTFMNFDVLKLDRSLVNNLVNSKNNRTVVKYVIEMCKEMGINCVAEGVENEKQLSLLKDFKCDLAQGYLFSEPVPLNEFEDKYLGC